MTDANSPPRPSSSESQCSDISDSNQAKIESSEFLVHSQELVMTDDHPESVQGKLGRQKRRRTSPEDQATLEAEYKSDPKPDKAARLEIVKKVALGEKEVQIWFQNRRQNTRRKSRPLLPHEIVAFGLNGMVAFSSDPATASYFGSSQDTGHSPSNSQLLVVANTQGSRNHVSNPTPTISSHEGGSPRLTEPLSQTSPISAVAVASNLISPKTVFENLAASASQDSSQSQSHPQVLPPLECLSDRRHASSTSYISPKQSLNTTLLTPSNSQLPFPSSCPERLTTDQISVQRSSQVRLSLSLDGKSELISSKISPLRPQPVRPTSSNCVPGRRAGGLRRSQSARSIGALEKLHSTALFTPRTPACDPRAIEAARKAVIRDARDRDAKACELTGQAEHECHNSALAAISLIRSTSNSSGLKSSLNKRNAPAERSFPTKQGKKPKLARVSSSLAKLQGNDKHDIHSPSGDSDKENWLPSDGNINPPRRRPMPSARPSTQYRRPVLGDGSGVVNSKSNTTVADSQKSRKKVPDIGQQIFEADVETFMKGNVSPSKDAVLGLMSLASGNWRA